MSETNKGFLKLLYGLFKTVLVLVITFVFGIIVIQRVTKNNINLFGYGIYTVVTESMVPKYKVYDMILAKKVDASTIAVDDDVVYMGEKDDFAGRIVTHRVVGIRKNGEGIHFVTKGINNDIEDPEIKESQVLGKVVHKFAILSFLSAIVNNIYGFYFIVFVPLVVIIFLEVVDMINEKKAMKDEEASE